MPALIGTLHLEEPGPAPASFGAAPLQQSVPAHQSLHPLAIQAPSDLPSRERGDHAGCRRSGCPARHRAPPAPARAAIDRRRRPDPGHTRQDGDWAALRDKFGGPGDALAHSQPLFEREFPCDLDLHRLADQRPLPGDATRQPRCAPRLPSRSAPAAKNCSRHFLSRLSGMSCSRQSSGIDFRPRSDASTISVFCWAVNFPYFLVSLNALSYSSSGPSSDGLRTEPRRLRRLAPHPKSTQEAVNSPTGSRPPHLRARAHFGSALEGTLTSRRR